MYLYATSAYPDDMVLPCRRAGDFDIAKHGTPDSHNLAADHDSTEFCSCRRRSASAYAILDQKSTIQNPKHWDPGTSFSAP